MKKEDIPLLADQFVGRFNHFQNKSIRGVSSEALSHLMAHDWPGNIRELENIIERSFILCREETISIDHLPEELTARSIPTDTRTGIRSAHDIIDAQAIHTALERNRFNRTATTRELGMHKTTLFRRVKKLGITLPGKDGRSGSRRWPVIIWAVSAACGCCI